MSCVLFPQGVGHRSPGLQPPTCLEIEVPSRQRTRLLWVSGLPLLPGMRGPELQRPEAKGL